MTLHSPVKNILQNLGQLDFPLPVKTKILSYPQPGRGVLIGFFQEFKKKLIVPFEKNRKKQGFCQEKWELCILTKFRPKRI